MALQSAILRRNFGIARALIDEHEDLLNHVDDDLEWDFGPNSALSCAAAVGSIELVEALLTRGAKVTADVAVGGLGPMCAAAQRGHAKIVDLLLSKGVDPDLTGDSYKTPLSLAIERGHYEVVDLLVSRNAQLNPKFDSPPLSSAVGNGNIEIVKILIEKGANPDGQKYSDETPLMLAAQKRYIEIIKILVEKGANPDRADGKHRTPLSVAAENGHIEAVEFLVENGANPNSLGEHGRTPFLFAAGNGHTKVVQFLAENSADMSPSTLHDSLTLAAGNGSMELVRWLLDKGATADFTNKSDQTPLFAAAKYGHIEIVLWLLDKGATPDFYNKYDETPLFIAAAKGYVEIAQVLIRRGAETNWLNELNETPLFIAAKMGHFDVVQVLVQNSADPNLPVPINKTPLYVAADNGHGQIVKYLIQKNAHPDVVPFPEDVSHNLVGSIEFNEFAQLVLDHITSGVSEAEMNKAHKEALIDKRKAITELMHTGHGSSHEPHMYSWLLWAARYGKHDLIQERIKVEDRSQLDIFNAQHQTPLSLAVQHGHYDSAKYLIFGNPVVDTRCTKGDNEGRTALSFAAENGSSKITKLLLSHGADQRIKSTGENWKDQIPLSIAAAKGHWEVVRTLLSDASSEPDFKDALGRTPLWWAASCGQAHTVENLLQHGVLAEIRDENGLTALSVAASNGHEQVVRQLINQGSLSLKDNNGHTALWLALLNGHHEVAQILMKKDETTLHCMVEGNDLATAEILLKAGYNIEKVDDKGLTPLRLALHLRKPEIATLLLQYSASSREIQAMEWLKAFTRHQSGILQLSVSEDGSGLMDLLPCNSTPAHTNMKTRIWLYQDGLSWIKEFFEATPPFKSEPYELQITRKSTKDQHMENWISLGLLSNESPNAEHFAFPGLPNLFVGWTSRSSAKAGEPVQPTLCLSSLQYFWIPEDEIDLFVQFLKSLQIIWIRICDLIAERLVNSMIKRLDQLRAEGRSLEMMRRLAKDSQRLMTLRMDFRNHLQMSRNYVNVNGGRSRYKDEALKILDDLNASVNDRLSDSESALKELLQIEFAWAAITESRISTSLGQNVMLLTYVSIFYLPLAFCAALWAIPNLTDRATLNSFVVTSVVVGLVTLLVAFNLENIASVFRGKYSQWRAKVVKDMHNDERWKMAADELESSLQTRSSPSEWLLVIFWLSRLIRKLKWERSSQQSQPRSDLP